MKETQNIKLVVIGDGGVGKTSMLITYATDKFPDEFIPTIFEHTCLNFNLDGIPINLELWDTASQEGYDRLQAISYPRTDVFLIVFSCVDKCSWLNVERRWIPELLYHMPKTPIVICCSKCDLRTDPDIVKKRKLVDLDEVRELMTRIPQVAAVVENSALKKINLKETFEHCMRYALVDRFPWTRCMCPFKVGDWVYAHQKGKRKIAIIRSISDTEMKVYYFERPYWFNSQTITQRTDIAPVPPIEIVSRIFRTWQPFGLYIPETVIEHIAEFVPERVFWTGPA